MEKRILQKGLLILGFMVFTIGVNINKEKNNEFIQDHRGGNGFVQDHRGRNGFVDFEHGARNGFIGRDGNGFYNSGGMGNG